jgi:hypothetical protein
MAERLESDSLGSYMACDPTEIHLGLPKSHEGYHRALHTEFDRRRHSLGGTPSSATADNMTGLQLAI